jgi:predicted PurR-regulated permease PerM
MNIRSGLADELRKTDGNSNLLDVLIRAALIFAMAALCYRIFSPFLALMMWAVILAVALYPAQQWVAAKIGGRQGIASILLVLLGVGLMVAPTAVLMSSLGDSIQALIHSVQANTLAIPAPPDDVATWPIVGKKAHALWSQAHADLPAFVQSMQPKIGDLAKEALAFVAGIGGGLLEFLAALVIADTGPFAARWRRMRSSLAISGSARLAAM